MEGRTPARAAADQSAGRPVDTRPPRWLSTVCVYLCGGLRRHRSAPPPPSFLGSLAVVIRHRHPLNRPAWSFDRLPFLQFPPPHPNQPWCPECIDDGGGGGHAPRGSCAHSALLTQPLTHLTCDVYPILIRPTPLIRQPIRHHPISNGAPMNRLSLSPPRPTPCFSNALPAPPHRSRVSRHSAPPPPPPAPLPSHEPTLATRTPFVHMPVPPSTRAPPSRPTRPTRSTTLALSRGTHPGHRSDGRSVGWSSRTRRGCGV